MEVVERQIELDSSWFSIERDVKRSPGLHLSDVIDFIEQKEREHDKTRLHRYAVAGFLWERALDKLIHLTPKELWDYVFTQTLFEVENPDVFRPGEQLVDAGECPICGGTGYWHPSGGEELPDCPCCGGSGRLIIASTPDGVSITKNCLEEWKYTSKSSRDSIRHAKFARWVNYQIPFYLKALRLNVCCLRVYFSKGDYTSGEPQWKEIELTYTNQELDEIFEMICLNARALVKRIYSNEQPNLQSKG